MYGMRLSELNEERLRDILLLYEKIVGGNVRQYALQRSSEPMALRLEYIRNNLSCGLRFGSSLNGGEDNAKLFFWREKPLYDETTRKRIDEVVRISFDPNVVSGPEAEKMKIDFEKAVDELLLKWKVNIELKTR
ncbi:MAG: hypothetical protein WC788_00985 [Candidatus Paceibacterota bacterium]|jgi:hypothetical protein